MSTFQTLQSPKNTNLHPWNATQPKTSFLDSASSELLTELTTATTTEHYNESQTIITQGEHGDCMYFLSTGSVEVIVNQQRIATIDAGGFFGEMALLTQEKRNATIRAITPVQLSRIERGSFLKLCAKHREFALHIQSVVNQRSLSQISL
ncbi:MAG: cyclic nucleotide-binding domain-containing protein [Verrucomicrobiota bacterium]